MAEGQGMMDLMASKEWQASTPAQRGDGQDGGLRQGPQNQMATCMNALSRR